MATTITTEHYLLYPSPRNRAGTWCLHTSCSCPTPYALIHLPDFDLSGPCSPFAACRKTDQKMGQLVTFELAQDQARFERLFTPD